MSYSKEIHKTMINILFCIFWILIFSMKNKNLSVLKKKVIFHFYIIDKICPDKLSEIDKR